MSEDLPRLGFGFLGAVLLAILLSLAFDVRPVRAQTLVTKNGPCDATITVRLEIWGPLATPELAARWKKNIEDKWNGATQDMIDAIADQTGVSDGKADVRTQVENPATHAQETHTEKEDTKYQDRDKLNAEYQKFLQTLGISSKCAQVNCCNICIKVEVRVVNENDPITPGWHQVKAVPEWEIRPGAATTRSPNTAVVTSLPAEAGGMPLFTTIHNRSYVNDSTTAQSAAGSGSWVDDPTGGWPSEAHEVGHLMGLPDEYADTPQPDGSKPSLPFKGHANDLMAHLYGWPEVSAYNQILKIAGLDMNCCHDPESTYTAVQQAIAISRRDIAGCHPDEIKDELADLERRRATIIADKIPIQDKYRLISMIDAQIARLKKAMVDCPPPENPVHEGFNFDGPWLYLGIDGTVWCTFQPTFPVPVPLLPPGYGPVSYDPGAPGTPITPGNPVTPGTPTTPSTPPPGKPAGNTPGPYTPPSLPGSTPETPWVPPALAAPVNIVPSGNTPKTTEKPPPQKTPATPPPILVNVKASSTAIQTGQNAAQLPGQQIKLFPSSTVNPDLPGTNTAKNDTGHDRDPMQGTTGGPDNSVTIPVNPMDLGGPGAAPLATAYNVGVGVDPTITGLIHDGPQTTPPAGAVPGAALAIWDTNFQSYRMPAAVAAGLQTDPLYETDWCRTKEPLAPGTEANMIIDPKDALPSAHLVLP